MPSTNPFADDPLPDNVVRLTSALDPLDPYASPPSVSEYEANREPGVGLWREGKWLVMHRDATFPPRCIFTNEPTETFGQQSITWAHLNDWRGQTVKLHYGILPTTHHRRQRTRTIAIVVNVLAIGLLILAVKIMPQFSPFSSRWFTLLPLFLIGIMVGATKVAWNAACPFTYVSCIRNYLWLSGASPAFLDSLPTWPGFRG